MRPSPSCSSSCPPPLSLPLSPRRSPGCGSESSSAAQKQEVRDTNTASDPSVMAHMLSFYLSYLLLLTLSLSCVVCVCVWSSQWRGGFAWDGSPLQFNWHPVLMVTGLLVLYGNGAVLYRVPLTWGQNKLPWKLLHAGLLLLSLILSIVGLCAVFDFHNEKKIPNLYSLHSWIGIAATALFALQWVFGLGVFLLPFAPPSLRGLLKPVHVWMGGGILWLSVAACISGINEKLFFVLKGGSGPSYSDLPSEAVLGNSLGVLIVAFGLVVMRILSNQDWQRPDSSPEDLVYTPLLQEENE
ncbi:LOW QUALITY PROTEIN: lysosomal membrane ascorbate-dependent ferrireductase CYB561A3 [Eleginops maclovinus]|uniref:LOW QUALITY PROTEIN: lysosomal membrane ascorbate-dependent ferrireductase CYB561A3 n=1 Tax=Eleginops maclovinus TaxID=56733 RepID=UPI003080007A